MDYQIHENWLSLIIPEAYDQVSLQTFLDAFVPSRARQHLLFQNKQIQVDGQGVHRQTILQCNQTLAIEAFDCGLEETGVPYTFDVMYEDDFFLLVNKPTGLLVHTDGTSQTPTLSDQLITYYQEHHIAYPVRPIHRLDKDTSGLLLINKCALLQPLMDQYLSQKQIYRTYLAVVEGVFDQKQGIINQPIGRDRHVSNRYRVAPNGKTAITKYRVIKQLKKQALVACTLETGRTHQIRVHMAAINHPIIFDPIYGTKNSKHTLALHAWKLTFYHPILEKNITVVCPPPKTFPIKP